MHRPRPRRARGVLALVTIALVLPLLAAAPPPLRARRFAVATADPLASEAGAAMLRAHGTAADAAVAAAFALGVVNSWKSGIGGGGFALVYRASDQSITFLDFRETAPAAATPDMFMRDGHADSRLSQRGGLAVAVPGQVAGLAELSRRFGRLGLARAVAPAVRLAERGFPARATRPDVSGSTPASQAALARVFTVDGRPGTPGTMLRWPALGRTLRAIGGRGPDAFYRGAIARAITRAVRAAGGVMTEADLGGYAVRERPALRGQYRGHTVVTSPPPSSGGVTLLEALALLSPHDIGRLGAGSSAELHLLAEALKAGFADRAQHLGDPDQVPFDPATLLDPARLRERAARIRVDRALPAAAWSREGDPPRDAGTSHVSIVDEEGNAVAMTITLNLDFGARLVAEETGIVLNDEMDDFTAAPGTPNAHGLVQSAANAIAPGKRPLSSMVPTMVLGPDGLEIVLGSSGGPRIISATLSVLVGLIDFGLDASAAVAAPRVHHQWQPDVLEIERDIPADVCGALRARGHAVRRLAPRSPGLGVTQLVVVRHDESGRILEAASDPRFGGAPAGE